MFKYLEGSTTTNRAFVMVLAPVPTAPQITGIAGAGTETITVSYTNTVPGKTYILQYTTELLAPGNWHNAASKVAEGTSDYQTEISVSSGSRFYRLSYTP